MSSADANPSLKAFFIIMSNEDCFPSLNSDRAGSYDPGASEQKQSMIFFITMLQVQDKLLAIKIFHGQEAA